MLHSACVFVHVCAYIGSGCRPVTALYWKFVILLAELLFDHVWSNATLKTKRQFVSRLFKPTIFGFLLSARPSATRSNCVLLCLASQEWGGERAHSSMPHIPHLPPIPSLLPSMHCCFTCLVVPTLPSSSLHPPPALPLAWWPPPAPHPCLATPIPCGFESFNGKRAMQL